LISFGTLGVVYEMTFRIKREFGVRKCIYKHMEWHDILYDRAHFDYTNLAHQYVSYFTDWRQEAMNSVWMS
jgi:hypothetical protein